MSEISTESLQQAAADLRAGRLNEAAEALAGAGLPVFGYLGSAELRLLLDALDVVDLQDGAVVLEEGETGDSFFVIIDGHAKVTRQDADGTPVELATLKPGEFFGEFAFLTSEPRSASVWASGDVIALEFKRDRMARLMNAWPEIRETLESHYRERLIGTMLRISPIFKSLPDDERQSVLEMFEHVTAEPHDVLIEQGQAGEALYLIVSGGIAVEAAGFDGLGAEVAYLEAGDFFGEISLVTGHPANATCVADCPSILYRLSRDKFETLVKKYPKVFAEITETARSRVRNTKTQLVSLRDYNQSGLI